MASRLRTRDKVGEHRHFITREDWRKGSGVRATHSEPESSTVNTARGKMPGGRREEKRGPKPGKFGIVPSTVEPCGLMRTYSLTFLPRRPMEAAGWWSVFSANKCPKHND
eukprot:13598706-Heterocapsa_arctica.AAC.1